MGIIAILSVIFLIFPIFITFYCYLDIEEKRLNFGLYAFNKLKVLGGYIKYQDKMIILHLTNKKAYAFYLKDVKSIKSGNTIKSLEFLDVYSRIVISQDKIFEFFALIKTFEFLDFAILRIRPRTNFQPKVVLSNGDESFTLKTVICFNFISIITIIIRKLLGGVCKTKKIKIKRL